MHRHILTRLSVLTFALTGSIAACNGVGQDENAHGDLPFAEGSPEALAVVAVANDRSLGVEEFDSSEGVGLDARAAQNLVAHRDGASQGPEDDNAFDNLAEVYGVPYCKTGCVTAILDYAKETGVYDQFVGGGEGDASVVFSPQATENSHLAKAAAAIDGAQYSVDVAMYSYSNIDPVKSALQRAMDRGVKIRFLANSDLANSSSKGGALEGMGINVRRVTKIMHHKFAIIDGPRDNDSIGRASTARIVSGSGNWSSSAATKYDENTLFLEGYAELALRMQRDFDTLWAGSKDVVYSDFDWDRTRADITDELIAQHEDADTDAYFTSGNFKPTSSQGWSVLGTTVVTDRIVEDILAADNSIEIATGHFLNEPIAEALVEVLQTKPHVKVDIVTDCQETSKSGTIKTLKNQIEDLGGSLVYKCNTYRWHYKYANQMHHKYLVIDSKKLITGSYNFSMNAETNTFENMIVLKGARHAGLVAQYQENFRHVRDYGSDGADMQDLYDEIYNGDSVPLTWSTPISMDLGSFLDLKDAIREACPATKSWENTGEAKTYNALFNQHPQWFTYCSKTGYAWPSVPVDMRID